MASHSTQIGKCALTEDITLRPGEWMPDEVSCLLDGGGITLNLVTADNRVDILADLKESMRVAITVINRETELLAVCLTTKKFIHVFRPNSRNNARFLIAALKCPRVEFYSVRGFTDSFLLRSNFGIALEELQVMNLESLDMLISLTIRSNNLYKSNTTVGYIHDHMKLSWLRPDELVEKYCQVSLDFTCTDEELAALKKDLFSTPARSAIRKRSALSYKLAVTIIDKYDELRNRACRNIYRMAKLSDKTMENYEREGSSSYADLCYWLGSDNP